MLNTQSVDIAGIQVIVHVSEPMLLIVFFNSYYLNFTSQIKECQLKLTFLFPNLWYTINMIVKGGATHGKQCTEGNSTY